MSAARLTRAVALAFVVGRGASAQSGRVPEIVTGAVIDGARDINFASGTFPTRAYVGQQVTYQIGIFLGEDMRSRLRSNPQFVPPDVRSMIAYDLPVPARLFQRREGDRTFDVHVFSRALFPLAAGVQVVPPARLTYAVPLTNSIFSREESHSARSAAHTLTVLEPPAAGRPAGFQGAVGRLALRARADAADARVGDPVLLTLTVSGVGNVGLFPRPVLQLPWAHTVAGPERVRVDSSAQVIAGDKEFDWVVTPRVAGSQEVPAVRYPYFNPYTEQYEVAVTAPLGIRVRTGALAASGPDGVDATPRPAVRRVLRGDVPLPWPTRPWFWAGVVLVPLPAALARWRRRRPAEPARSPRRRLSDLLRAPAPDPREVRRAVRAAMAGRIPALRDAALADGASLERTLRRSGVSAPVARDARRLMAQLDELAYAGTAIAARDLGERTAAILDAVDREATPVSVGRTTWRLPRSGAPLLAVALAAAAGWLAAQPARDATTFAEAIGAWDAGNAARARDLFGEVATRRPRAADAWANLGTAAWHVGDTAQAVVGWQRALRLEPLADDVRARLGQTPSFRNGFDGDVPPLPVNLAASLGALLWVAGWTLAARRAAPRADAALLGGAALAALATLWIAERQRGERTVVVLAAERLREVPAIGARPGATLAVGETGRIVATQGAWERVRFADDREGWIDASRLASLELPPVR